MVIQWNRYKVWLYCSGYRAVLELKYVSKFHWCSHILNFGFQMFRILNFVFQIQVFITQINNVSMIEMWDIESNLECWGPKRKQKGELLGGTVLAGNVTKKCLNVIFWKLKTNKKKLFEIASRKEKKTSRNLHKLRIFLKFYIN